MRPRIEHIMAMIWRTENPNYIIIVKNKAGKEMDFTKFKAVEHKNGKPKSAIPKKKDAQYILTIEPYLGLQILVRVVDTHNFNEEVLRVEAKLSSKQVWIARAKKLYKPLRYDS